MVPNLAYLATQLLIKTGNNTLKSYKGVGSQESNVNTKLLSDALINAYVEVTVDGQGMLAHLMGMPRHRLPQLADLTPLLKTRADDDDGAGQAPPQVRPPVDPQQQQQVVRPNRRHRSPSPPGRDVRRREEESEDESDDEARELIRERLAIIRRQLPTRAVRRITVIYNAWVQLEEVGLVTALHLNENRVLVIDRGIGTHLIPPYDAANLADNYRDLVDAFSVSARAVNFLREVNRNGQIGSDNFRIEYASLRAPMQDPAAEDDVVMQDPEAE